MIDRYGAARNRSSARRGDRMPIEIRVDPFNAANFDSGRILSGRAWDEPEQSRGRGTRLARVADPPPIGPPHSDSSPIPP
ncbi:MAG: hypothetical protein AAGJ81_11980 [Verrucomicrobiota bacterium]